MTHKKHKIIVFGTGRSGTTALYSLIRDILSKDRQTSTRRLYEPFLRNPHSFDGCREDIKKNNRLINSLSFEGIYNHLQLPLLIQDPEPFQNNRFLCNTLQQETDQKHVLAKFIRANGRYLLLKRIAPDYKFIFIIRNPIDVINSILKRFSFYGGEFHTDDYHRFIRQVNQRYGADFSTDSHNAITLAEKELLYWYYMNLFALETMNNSETRRNEEKNTLLICHEAYKKDADSQVKRICQFLGIDYQPEFSTMARIPTGSLTREFEIPEALLDTYKTYLAHYSNLLSRFHLESPMEKKEILEKYRITKKEPLYKKPYYGLHGRAIIREMSTALTEKDRQIKELQEQLNRKNNQ